MKEVEATITFIFYACAVSPEGEQMILPFKQVGRMNMILPKRSRIPAIILMQTAADRMNEIASSLCFETLHHVFDAENISVAPDSDLLVFLPPITIRNVRLKMT